jgi:predicted tellurium resistance membrane protein TerC
VRDNRCVPLQRPARLTASLFVAFGQEISGRDLIVIVGGLFLLGKSTHEIHQRLEGDEGHLSARVTPSFANVLVQILVLDVVFSLDSVITAVGMVDDIGIMISAVIVAVGFMMVFDGVSLCWPSDILHSVVITDNPTSK